MCLLDVGCPFRTYDDVVSPSLLWPEDRTGYDELGNDPIRSEVHQVSAAVRMRLGVQKLRVRI